MAEVTERVLRWTKDGPPPPCPTCDTPVEGYSADTETIWVLKDEYAGMIGLPVGPEFGRQVPVRTRMHLQPCGHEVDRVEVTTPPAAPTLADRVEDLIAFNPRSESERHYTRGVQDALRIIRGQEPRP